MKKSIFAALIVCLAFSFQSKAQFTFSASPGLNLNTASFGYRTGNFVPFVGFQMVSTSVDFETDGSLYGDYSTKANLLAFMPTIGLKYFALESGDVNAYFTGSVTNAFLSGKAEFDGTNEPEFEDALDNVSAWGIQAGFGAEYFFSENFSLGGEFGLNFIKAGVEGEYTETYYDENLMDYVDNTYEANTKVGFNPTYTKISLNFYF